MIRIVKADVQNQFYLPENQPIIVRFNASSQEDITLMPIISYALATYTEQITAMVVKVRAQGFSGFEIEARNKTAWVSLDILHDFGHPFSTSSPFSWGQYLGFLMDVTLVPSFNDAKPVTYRVIKIHSITDTRYECPGEEIFPLPQSSLKKSIKPHDFFSAPTNTATTMIQTPAYDFYHKHPKGARCHCRLPPNDQQFFYCNNPA